MPLPIVLAMTPHTARQPERYLVAARHRWNREVFQKTLVRFPGSWRLVDRPEALTMERVAALHPRYIFFLHWSWRVPEAMLRAYECVGFHLTDLPYGRGGSPLQNLIVRGHRQTRLTAFRLVSAMDAGPVYLKARVSLNGSAEDVYRRAATTAAGMIRRILTGRVTPRPQRGRVVRFARRTPPESRIPKVRGVTRLYDFIRMLDADGYPHAFLDYRGFRYEFRRAALRGARLQAEVRIMPIRTDE